MKIVILAGGKGTRLFPLSTIDKPKQFLSLIDNKPMIINTIERFLGLCNQNDIIIVTGKQYEELTKRILLHYGYSDVNVLLEPLSKNTAPAIILAVRYCKDILNVDNNESIFVVPSDHAIKPNNKYQKLVNMVIKQTELSDIVLLGVKPQYPATEYGYIKTLDVNNSVKSVQSFKEKPDKKTAKTYYKSKCFYWNAGMFGFLIKSFEQELSKYSEDLYQYYNLDFDNLYKKFDEIKAISFDYAVIEKSKNTVVLPMDCDWSDLGSWDALFKFNKKDKNGNIILGNVSSSNCTNSFFYCEDGNLVVQDFKKIIAIKTKNTVYIIKSILN